jgi:hypothetical protein
MAPAHSRVAGFSALAAGVVAGPQLFALPGGQPPRTQPKSSNRGVGVSASALSSSRSYSAGHQEFSTSFTALLLAGAGLAAARTPASRCNRTSAAATAKEDAPSAEKTFSPSKQLGAMVPLGYFDPLGFTREGDEEGFHTLRAAELKHGRVAMMASVGLIGQHFIKFPGFETVPAGFGALNTGGGIGGFAGIFFLSGLLEFFWQDRLEKEPGNFGDPFGVKMYNDETRSKEISNGRFAMICVLGIFAAEVASGKDAIQQFGL